jgi:hypothetical protein
MVNTMKLLTPLAITNLFVIIFIFYSNIAFSTSTTNLPKCKRDAIYNIPSKDSLKEAKCKSETEFLFTPINNEKDKKLSNYKKPSQIGKKPAKIIILED